MPEICRFLGIVIAMHYYDHDPPHFHAKYSGHRAAFSIEELNIPGNSPSKINVIKLNIEQEEKKQIVLYWFQSRGRFISSEYWQKIYLVIDSITKRRTDGSFVRLIAPVIDGDKEKALKDLKNFAREVIPVLEDYLPG